MSGMADFDPFANQGGPVAWDPEHDDDSRAKAEELLRGLGENAGAEPGDFGGGTAAEGEDAAETDAGAGESDPAAAADAADPDPSPDAPA